MVILLYFMVYLMLLTPDDKTRQIAFFTFALHFVSNFDIDFVWCLECLMQKFNLNIFKH